MIPTVFIELCNFHIGGNCRDNFFLTLRQVGKDKDVLNYMDTTRQEFVREIAADSTNAADAMQRLQTHRDAWNASFIPPALQVCLDNSTLTEEADLVSTIASCRGAMLNFLDYYEGQWIPRISMFSRFGLGPARFDFDPTSNLSEAQNHRVALSFGGDAVSLFCLSFFLIKKDRSFFKSNAIFLRGSRLWQVRQPPRA